MTAVYHDAALEEAIEAAGWYERQQPGLGIRFLSQWRTAEARMVASPEIHRCFEGELRKCRFDVFPYALVFRICGTRLQIIAVMHMSRRPGYWRGRLGEAL